MCRCSAIGGGALFSKLDTSMYGSNDEFHVKSNIREIDWYLLSNGIQIKYAYACSHLAPKLVNI